MASHSTLNLNGRIEKTDIPTLLRSVEKDKLSGELSFNRQGEKIELYFLFGQLYHSKWREVIGIDAVSELLSWKSGNYAFTEGIIPAQASINDDIDRILASSPAANRISNQPGAALAPVPEAVPVSAPPSADGGDFLDDLAPFDLASLDAPPPPPSRPQPVTPYTIEKDTPSPVSKAMSLTIKPEAEFGAAQPPAMPDNRHAPSPPSGGLYKTRFFCLPTGEQMATSLVATGPQLEEELLHLSEVGFTGYLLGTPEVEGLPGVGICLFRGRFIHAFLHSPTSQGLYFQEGEKAYRAILDQRSANSARFYWFYELPVEVMRSAISLLTPPTRYSRLEVRIIRFKELLRMLSEESHTGCVRITIPSSHKTQGTQGQSGGECAYIPIFKGSILGLWTENAPRLTNDGQLLQRFLNEPQAFLDLHTTAPVADPGLPLEALVNVRAPEVPPEPAMPQVAPPAPPPVMVNTMREHTTSPLRQHTTGTFNAVPTPPAPEPEQIAPVDDGERQLRLITAISRMESTWTQAQRKDRLETHTALLILAGFANDVLSLNESVSGRKALVDVMGRGLRQELMPFRNLFQNLDLLSGRINLVKLLKEYDMYAHDGEKAASEYYRETSRALRTLIRSSFQNYVSLIRQENVRFECQEMYEIFLQDVVKRI